MNKLWPWLSKNILKIGICFLLFFIPLYPKFPLLDIQHTWVYIRLEDLLIALLVFVFLLQLIKKKVSLKTPLSLPIFLYWLIGGVSLIFSLLVLRPHLANFFPKVAFLHFLRRIEYLTLFFIAFSAVKSREDVYHCLLAFTLGVIGVVVYGFGQKFAGWPAFLTMNEEFAKGIPLYLPPQARTTSTFGGHYDLAAYLVFVLALFFSLIFGLKSKKEKLTLFLVGLAAYFLLLFTASRISFAVYLITVSLVLLLQKRKWLIIPVILVSLFLMKEVEGVSTRFGKTLRVEQVVYDLRTGQPIALLEELMPFSASTPDAGGVVKKLLPAEKEEELPLGSGFLEVPFLEKEASMALKIKRIDLKTATEAAHLATISGEFLVKRALVYDIAFTTRLQGTWPRALNAFKRNILLGSGYSSISLATDDSYLRALGETGILGLMSFLSILFTILLITRQSLRKINSTFNRSVIIGIVSGVFGLSLNAVLIDVFEASKVAYILWMMVGILAGLFSFSVKKKESLIKEAKEFLREPIPALVLLAGMMVLVFYSALDNYFTADDFTWLRWAVENKLTEGFFSQPLTKIIFYFSYQFFGLKPQGYHLISFGAHFLVSTTVYFIALFLSRSSLIAFLSSFFFLLHPLHGETIFWISNYSNVFGALFYFLSFYLFLNWNQKQKQLRKIFYGIGSFFFFILSLSFSWLALTLPLIIIFYWLIFKGRLRKLRVDKLLFFSLGWLVISFLPAMALGSMSERDFYIASLGSALLVAIIIQKLFHKTKSIVALILIVMMVAGFYFWDLKRVESNWRKAGEISNKILRTLSTNYDQFPEKATLYFVNPPLRIGRAWVFSAGLKDSLWLIYRNEKLKVIKENNLQSALNYQKENKDTYIFIYQDGRLQELKREGD